MVRKAPKCKIGFPCGKTCINRQRLCYANLSTKDNKVVENFSQFVNRLVGIGNSNQSSIEAQLEVPIITNIAKDYSDFTEYEKVKIPAFKDGEATKERIRIISDYTQAAYKRINKKLRGFSLQSYDNEEEVDEQIKQMEDAYEALNPLGEDINTYRGAYLPKEILDSIQVDSIWSDNGYSSTSKDPDIAKEDFEGNIIFEYKLKSGTENAKDISLIGLSHEKEVLIKPKAKFKIISREEVDGQIIVQLEEI